MMRRRGMLLGAAAVLFGAATAAHAQDPRRVWKLGMLLPSTRPPGVPDPVSAASLIPAETGRARLRRREEPRRRPPLRRGAAGPPAGHRPRVGRSATGRDRAAGCDGDSCGEAGDRHDSDRVLRQLRSRRDGHRDEPRASRRQRDREFSSRRKAPWRRRRSSCCWRRRRSRSASSSWRLRIPRSATSSTRHGRRHRARASTSWRSRSPVVTTTARSRPSRRSGRRRCSWPPTRSSCATGGR